MMISGYECMTVGELIAHLQTMPADEPVVYQCCSSWAAMTKDQISHATANEKKYAAWSDVIIRISNDHDRRLFGGAEPKWVGGVFFPGN